MLTFRIEGADRTSGDDVAYDVEAMSEAEARAEVEPHMLISSIVRTIGPKPPPSPSAPTPLQVSVQCPRKPRESPSYTGLGMVALVSMVAALLYYICAVVLVLLGAVRLSVGRRSGEALADPVSEGLTMIATGIGAMFGGILLHGISAALSALRDIARNSFRW